jgi:4-amino-4-deoxy-L-arabinose transferase-like glycosyltransferase
LLLKSPLLGLLALALALRLLVHFSSMHADISIDGAEYCRMAEEIVAHGRIHGMLPGGANMMPPLQPLLVAGWMQLTGFPAAQAAQWVSILASVACVCLGFICARALAGDLAGFAAGMLFATAPLLLLLGTSEFAEPVQCAFLLAATALLLRKSSGPSWADALGAGVLFGLAALARIESLALGGLAALYIAARGDAGFVQRACRAAGFLLLMLLQLLPWAWHLQDVTGAWRLEAKSGRVAATVERVADGMSYAEANYGVSAEGVAEGPWLRPDLIHTEPEVGLMDAWRARPALLAAHSGRQLARYLWWLASGVALGSLLLLAAMLPALWPVRDARLLYCLALAMAMFFLASLYKPVPRYAAPAIVFLDLIAAVGLARIAVARKHPRVFIAAAACVLALSSLRGVPDSWHGLMEGRDASCVKAAQALAARPRHAAEQALWGSRDGIWLCDDARLPFHCGARWLPLPAAPTAHALARYAATTSARVMAWRTDDSSDARPGPLLDTAAIPGWRDIDNAPAGWRVLVR